MTSFNIDFNWVLFEKELDEFGDLLRDNDILEKENQIQPFFKNRHHLCSGVGLLNIFKPNSIIFDFEIGGELTCDLLLISNHHTMSYLVKFEDAQPDSLFAMVENKEISKFSSRFEHSYSQILEWFLMNFMKP